MLRKRAGGAGEGCRAEPARVVPPDTIGCPDAIALGQIYLICTGRAENFRVRLGVRSDPGQVPAVLPQFAGCATHIKLLSLTTKSDAVDQPSEYSGGGR